MSTNYCIYTHTGPSGKVYVGQSKNHQRRWGYHGEQYFHKKKNGEYVQRLFVRAIIKYGWDNFEHKIILKGISKREADYAEKYLIRWYKMHHLSYNITDGGEGTCGSRGPLSEERKKKITEFMRTNHPMKGRKHTPEALAKITYANRHRVYSEEQKAAMADRMRTLRLGMSNSEESKRKMSEYKKAHPETWIGGWNKKEVHQYDLDGNYVASYPSYSEASIKVAGKERCGDIYKCVEGKAASAFGYIWRTEKVDHIDMSKYKIFYTPQGARIYDMSDEGKMKRRAAHGKPVNQYSLDGKYLATFNSVTDAAEKTKSNSRGITGCCKHQKRYKTAGGYLWEYDNGDNRHDKAA